MAGRPDIIGGHYHVGKRIGEGSFGVIYQGFNDLNDSKVAMKFEPWKTASPQLKDEYRTYKLLAGCPGIPTIYYFAQEAGFNCLVMELLGPSLEEVFDKCGRKFSLGTVALLAIEMISRIQSVHEKNLIYRDIKPDNFLVGPRDDGTIYLVDFGMAKSYINPATGKHIAYSEKKSLSGTARYMSINTHRGREQSRRDDLEALGHVFLYFLRGSLPWQGIKAQTNKEKYERIGDKKQRVHPTELCAGYPEEFCKYLSEVRNLDFEATPPYSYYKSLFRGLLAKLEPSDCILDWQRKGICLTRPLSPMPIELEHMKNSEGHVAEQQSSLAAPPSPAPGPRSPLHSPRPAPVLPSEPPLATVRAEDQQQQQQRKKKSIWKHLFCI